ncbi:MAG: YrrS family protein [Sporolactobacillus sp.]
MRNHRGDGSSRFEQRKSRADRLLNWTIGIVSLLILAVGCIILISIFTASSPNRSADQAAKTSQSQSHKSSTSSSRAAKDSSKVSNDQSSSSSISSESSESSDENHQASYDKGSADWNAQIQAIAEATGIDQNQMTILWLGNGGSPNSSLARVAPKSASNSVYVVHLVYQNGKWQADNVRKP